MAVRRCLARCQTFLILQLFISQLVLWISNKLNRKHSISLSAEDEIQQNNHNILNELNNHAPRFWPPLWREHGRGKRYLAARNLHTELSTQQSSWRYSNKPRT